MAHVKLDVQLLRFKPEGVVQAQRHFTHRLVKDRGTVDALPEGVEDILEPHRTPARFRRTV